MRNTTLCYIIKDDSCLMLHRTKKKNDQSHDKWLGIGGKFEDRESPEDCALREIKEETGLIVTGYKYRGIVTFVSDEWETEYMHLFTVTEFEGDIIECDEGDLEWMPMWEGDRIFLGLIASDAPFFSLKLEYIQDRLMSAVLNGRLLEI